MGFTAKKSLPNPDVSGCDTASMFSLENVLNLGMLLFLQLVLGFDNLLYIAIESSRAPESSRAAVRKAGILIALALRVVLLFVVVGLLDAFEAPFFEIGWEGVLVGSFNFATLVFLLGGVFIMFTAVKEINHLLSLDDVTESVEAEPRSPVRVVTMIVVMNLIFSFDSILSALAITRVFAILVTAIVASGVAMLVLADRVSEFIQKNRKYEVLGLFILLIVGVVLLGEGGHEAHLQLFGFDVEPMAKTTFYFSIVVLVCVDILQSGYQKKLAARRARRQQAPAG